MKYRTLKAGKRILSRKRKQENELFLNNDEWQTGAKRVEKMYTQGGKHILKGQYNLF